MTVGPSIRSEPASPQRILIADDNPVNVKVLTETLGDLGHELLVARDGATALDIAFNVQPAMVLLDVRMPGIDGFEVCRRLKEHAATRDMTVVFLSALDQVTDKIQGLELGAVDFITKPFQAEEVVARVNTHLTIHRLRRDLEHELRVARQLLDEAGARLEGPLVGESDAVRRLREEIAVHAATDDTLLLAGAPGSGQEATARAIHDRSNRRGRPFIYLDCVMTERDRRAMLIGLERLRGTRQLTGQAGKLELADGGTVYLDRVNELPIELQASLTEVLEALERDRANGICPIPDARVIASATCDLAEAARTSRLHPPLGDLLSRRRLHVPRLTERREDIPQLADHFVRQQSRRLGKVVERISDETIERLMSYAWPGNIHELQGVIERALVVADGIVLEIDDGLLAGGIPLGRYRLQRRLGAGGMGEVWLARHHLLARPVAVKFIRSDCDVRAKQAAVERFHREAQATANLHSPNTVRLYDFGTSETGSFYYVMEALNGIDLQSMVTRFGPLPPERTICFLRQACRALIEAHQFGLIHRDIKPANLFVCRLGAELDYLKVLDFGMVSGASEREDLWGAAHEPIHGTPAYMAPELALGDGEVDGRADIYALGCVAYWLLTGKPVFEADHPLELLSQHRSAVPRAPSEAGAANIPAGLERIVLDALQKNPERRPATASELWKRLGAVGLDDAWTEERANAWWERHLPEDTAPGVLQGPASELETQVTF